jgi:hypothetical protein
MSEQINCPVCFQGGIGNYKLQDVVCPQCNSDLKPFRLLEQVAKSKNKSRRFIFPLLAVVVLLIAISSYLQFNTTEIQSKFSKEARLNKELRSKVKSMSQQQKVNTGQSDNKGSIIEFNYKVKQGDFPWKIAAFFYGDGMYYKKIESDNNLVQPYELRVGQELVIKLGKE